MQKSTEICLILLIGVVMIFKYGKRFRFAPSFNKVVFVFQICTRFLSIVAQFVVKRYFCHKLGFNEKPFI